MKEEKKPERNFELRSEKVRSIVGQIPSSLIRYGITAIGMVLLCLFAVAYYLPYKQVYSGTATIHKTATTPVQHASAFMSAHTSWQGKVANIRSTFM